MGTQLDWRRIEAELERWFRYDEPGATLDTQWNTDKIAVFPYGEGPCLNLTSLARRLADTMTLRLVEPTSVASARLPSAEAGED